MSRNIIFIWLIFLFAGCSGSVDGMNKDLRDSQSGFETTQAGSLTIEQVLQINNWDLDGQPMINAQRETEETCITWKFNHIDSFRIAELGKFIIKKGVDEVPEYYSSVQDCSEFFGTLQLFFESKTTERRYLISSVERKASAAKIPTWTWINFDSASWDVKRVSSLLGNAIYLTESEIEVELTGEGLTKAKSIRVGDDSCFSDSVGCWIEYPIQRFLKIRLPKLNSQYDLRLWLVLENGQNTDSKSIWISHDDISPTGGKIEIRDYMSGSSEITKNKDVELKITLDNPQAAFMYITNNRDCETGGQWWSNVSDTYWTLGTLNERSYVYVKFRDSARNETECYSASILHDDIPPTGSIAINFGSSVAASDSATLSIGSVGATKMRISDGLYCSTSGSNWETIGTQKSWTLLPYKDSASVSIKFMDQAGNESSCQSATITTPYVYLQHKWLEGNYYPKISTDCYPTTRDYRILNTKSVQYPPFTDLSLLSVSGCTISKINNTEYVCDHTLRNLNCMQYSCSGCLTACSGRYSTQIEYPSGWLTCKKPSAVP